MKTFARSFCRSILVFVSVALMVIPLQGAAKTASATRLQISAAADSLVVLQSGFNSVVQDNPAKTQTNLVVQNLVAPIFTAAANAGGGTADLVVETNKSQQIVVFSEPQLTGRILAYPSPMRFLDGQGEITYSLNGNMDVEMKIYNMFGSLIYQNAFPQGSNGGKQNYNNPPFTIQEVGQALPAGVYFVVLVTQGKLLGKGKLAILP
jgi:hypothetical protein